MLVETREIIEVRLLETEIHGAPLREAQPLEIIERLQLIEILETALLQDALWV